LDVSGPWTLSQTTSISQLRGYLAGSSSAGKLRAVVYADSGGSPGGVVTTSNEVAVASGRAASWIAFALPAPVSLPAGSYWLGYWYADSSLLTSYDSGISSQRYRTATYSSSGSAPASFGSASSADHDYSLYALLGAAGTSPPANSVLPVISGTAQQGQTLTASTGTWSGSPTSYAYQWRRCDTAGAGCADVAGATVQTYTLVSGDVGSTIRVVVTATNGGGSTSATAAQTATVSAASGSVPAGFTSVVTDSGCGGCSVTTVSNGLQVAIQGGADTLDTAYALDDFGGTSGLSGRTYTRDLLALAASQTLNANLAVFQVRDVSDTLVYELYLSPARTLILWSPAGGLQANSINQSTGVTVPNDGTSTLQVEVSALANNSLIVRVNGVDKITLTGLAGASTGNQRYLRAGIDHYDTATTNEPVTTTHTYVAITQTTWLGAPT
jgi:hypothetical protein